MAELKIVIGLLVAVLCFGECMVEKHITANKEHRRLKRLLPLMNFTAPPYIFNASNPINKTVQEITDYTCGKTKLCERSQGYFNYATKCFRCDKCRCDSSCHLYGDCCNDILHNSQPHDTSLLACVEKLDNRNRRPNQKEKFGELMVSKCPRRSQKVSTLVASSCENPDVSDMEQAAPVWAPSSGLTFRNKFCALCNLEDEFEPWKLSASCSLIEVLYGAKSQADIWKVTLDSANCSITSKAPGGSDQHLCRLNVIDTCPDSYTTNNATLVELCQNFTSAVFFKYKWYKNAFCAICNGASVNRGEECDYIIDHRGPYSVPPLSVLLKFYNDGSEQAHGDSQERATCPPSSVYNPILGNCSSLLCPQRHVPVVNICKPVFQSAVGLGYEISIILLPSKPVRAPSSGSIRRKYESWLRERLQRYKPYVLTPLDVAVFGERVLTPERHVIVTSLQVKFNIVSTQNVTMDTIESDLKKLKRESWIFTSRDNVATEFVSTFQRQFSEFSAQDTATDVILTRDISSDSSTVFGRTCERDGCLRHVEFLDISDTLECAYVDYNITVFGSFNISLHSSSLTRNNKTVQLKKGTFKTFGGKIDICTSELELVGELFKEPQVDAPGDPMWLSVLSTICLAVSCVFLFLTFVTYLLVPELQTLPGKNSMALVFFLFLAQMLFLCGIQATENEHLCRAIGITLHYLWLVTFFWMFICAFHMHSLFTNLCNNTESSMKSRLERKQFIHYTLLACLAPVIFVGGCIGYSEAMTGGNNFGYGGQLCFIDLIEAKGIFFAAPVLLMLIFNVFFYIRTVLAIRRIPDVVACNKSNRNYVGIYFRLSILLGLGWIFGFIPFDFSRVIFLILSGGQGCFIFFTVFAFKRVKKELSKKIPCCKNFLSEKSVFYTSTGSSEMSSKVNLADH